MGEIATLAFNVTDNVSDSDTSIHFCDDSSDSDFPDFFSLLHPDNLRQGPLLSIVMVLGYLMNFLVGLVGNGVVITVILLKPSMQTVRNMFLLNLAIADLLVIIVCTPATLFANLFIPWILGAFLCKAVAYLQGVSVCASAYSIASLSLDRCFVIQQSMKRHPGFSKNQAWAAIIIIWILSFIITSPWPFAFQIIKEDCQIYCYEVWTDENLGKIYFVLVHLISCYCIPLLCICCSNIAIWCFVSKRQAPQDSVSISAIQRRRRKGLGKTIGIVISAFLICWLPLYVMATRIKLTSVDDLEDWEEWLFSYLFPIAQWLGSLNSSVNPVIYAFTNKKFRDAFRQLYFSVAINVANRISSMRGSRRRSQSVLQRHKPLFLMNVNTNEAGVAHAIQGNGNANNIGVTETMYI